MVQIKVKWVKEEYDVDIEEGSTVEVFKIQMWTLTNVPADRQKFIGFPGGALKDTDDLQAKVAKLKAGAKITMMGTAEEGQLKAPTEKVVFEEDLTPAEKAKILKEAKVEVLPVGLKNLGNTCYMNACLQCMNAVPELRTELAKYTAPGAEDRDIDSVLTTQFRNLTTQLANSHDEVVPLQFVMALRQRFPRFAEMQNGGYMQQDADECLKGLLTVLGGTMKTSGGNAVDDLFQFTMKSSLKCLECDEEPLSHSSETQRTLVCHLGTQTDPVSHLHQGISLSMKEHIEKNSPVLGRNAQYEKNAALDTLPPYLVIQYARFGYKGANEWAGTSAAKVKLIRKCAFAKTFDLFECSTDELKAKLTLGRQKKKEIDDAILEQDRKALADGKPTSTDDDVEMTPVEDTVMGGTIEEWDTGAYELIAIVSHKGRTADGGHYVGWAMHSKANPKDKKNKDKDDRWCCFDDENVSIHNFKDIVGPGIDLQGGKADTQIAYLSIYKKVTAKDTGNVLGKKEEPAAAGYKAPDAPAASS